MANRRRLETKMRASTNVKSVRADKFNELLKIARARISEVKQRTFSHS